MEKDEFLRILKKYTSGQASAEEERFLHAYYKIMESGADPMGALNASEKERIKKAIKADLDRGIVLNESYAAKKSAFYIRRFAAAVVLLILSAGLYFYAARSKPGGEFEERKTAVNDITPGGNKAVLTLADGSKVILNDLKSGTQITQGNSAVSKTKEGQLVYDASAHNSQLTADISLPAYNTIATPRGGQYMIILPDGTKVWLNAESSLRFPTEFSGKERKVDLAGEAYFEVAKAGTPFYVNSAEQQIEVLGTHFNVMAYADEAVIKTTLLEGSVKVSNLKSKVSNLLKPGQQSSMGKEGRIKIAAVNTDEAVAWKNGYFLFNNESLESIMRKVSKWYDVQVDYKGNTDNLYFGGMVSRSKNISAVLKIMELTGDVQFKIIPDGKERRVIVMP